MALSRRRLSRKSHLAGPVRGAAPPLFSGAALGVPDPAGSLRDRRDGEAYGRTRLTPGDRKARRLTAYSAAGSPG